MSQVSPVAEPRKSRWTVVALVLGLVVLSPLLAESLSGYDVTTGDPAALLGGLLVLGPLYGCPALLIREVARRRGLGWPGIAALAAGFGVIEAGVIDQSMFALSYREIPYWDDLLRPTLIEPLGMAPYLVMAFVGGHIIWSFCAPIALVEALAGPEAHRPWLRARGLTVAVVLYLGAATLVWYDHLQNAEDLASLPQVIASLLVAVLLFLGALAVGRRPEPAHRDRPVPPVWAVSLVCLVTALTYNLLPPTWPGFAAGVALLVLAACALRTASASTRWTQPHVVAVAGGAVLAMAVTAFFVTPLGDVSAIRQYTHNTVFLLGSLALTGWALRRAGVATPYKSDPLQERPVQERPVQEQGGNTEVSKPSEVHDRPTVLREPVWSTAAVYVVAALLGAGAGWLLGLLAEWLVSLPYAPMKGPARLVAVIPGVVLPALGALAGLVVGLIAHYEQLVIRLHEGHVVLTRKGHSQRLSREDIATICRDGGKLVVLGIEGGELARVECGLSFGRVAETVTEHGYRWADSDPYKDDFRLWVPDLPGLSQGANALLTARQSSLKDDNHDDARILREELAGLGVVVKDEKRRQYVRTLGQVPLGKNERPEQ